MLSKEGKTKKRRLRKKKREKTRWLAFYLKGRLMSIAHCLNEQQGVKTA